MIPEAAVEENVRMTITEFLEARIAEDEAAARRALDRPEDAGIWEAVESFGSAARVEGAEMIIYDEGGHTDAQAAHIARHDPARVLAECAAKRAMAEEHSPVDGWCVACERETPCPSLRITTAVYADHADYDKRWAK